MPLAALLNPATLTAVGGLLERFIPDPEAREKAKLELLELNQRGELAQIEVNKAEAAHKSVFVAGWRPFIGWTCGIGFLVHVLLPPVYGILRVWHPEIGDPPVLDFGQIMPVLLGMLGIGGLRSWEKKNGLVTNAIRAKD